MDLSRTHLAPRTPMAWKTKLLLVLIAASGKRIDFLHSWGLSLKPCIHSCEIYGPHTMSQGYSPRPCLLSPRSSKFLISSS
ncbi:hypothetical protein PAXRUDRAFT_824761 [Paxillus rubicundulus Ve08.2h10]|uniref:Uncharacterized protein n=1 Tax=Paxillus rubicundulus Ve08.2h10 TaxID=930991 RepID=A0A0D0DHD4_9AGAM|nr:hypothetical protein PAXRUDRAFT_824761 [Paxillus rubicundulus Ve08.2h10]